MSSVPIVVSIIAPFTAGGFTLAGVWLTQRYNERQRAREREAAATAKADAAVDAAEATVRELLDAVSAMHLVLLAYVPRYNSWSARLPTLGLAFLEFAAGRAASGYHQGLLQLGRVTLTANERDMTAADGMRVPLERVMSAANRVALLPDVEIRAAALHLAQVIAEAGPAYAADNLWSRKKATAGRQQADVKLYAAIEAILAVIQQRRTAPVAVPPPPASRWRQIAGQLRITGRSPTALPTSRQADESTVTSRNG